MVAGDILAVAHLCAVSAMLTAVICCYAETLGRAARLIDKPDGIRKLHDRETPLVGGLALLIPSLAVSAVYLAGFVEAPLMAVAVAAAAFTLLVGTIDDRAGLSPVWRLVALTFVIFTVFSINPLFVVHTVRFAIFDVKVALPLGHIAGPVMALAILGFVNAANMADGMNGQLLGSIVIWSAFIAYYLGIDAGMPFIAIICSAAVTLVFNLRARLFTGSAGSYAASLLVGLGAIAAYRQTKGTLPTLAPIFWFWLPVLDCVRLMASRISAGRSPLAGDRNHFHHMLLDRMPVRSALLVYLGLLAAPGAAAIMNWTLGSAVLLLCLGGYAAFVALQQGHISRTRTAPALKLAPPARVSMITPNVPRRLIDIAPRPKAAVALQDSGHGTKTRASL